MNTKHLIVTIVLFAALTIAGISLIVFGQDIANSALPLVGSAMFAAALTFFLVEMVHAGFSK
jgi:hypothetical protein